ncbi:MAG: hypothetical protein R6V32_06315 [Bacteroidales bacterium]
MNKSLIITFLVISFGLMFISGLAQSDSIKPKTGDTDHSEIVRPDKLATATGVGIGYGNLGQSFYTFPWKNTGIFFSLGFSSGGMVYNTGVKFRFINDTVNFFLQPYLTLMYGFNTIVIYENMPSRNRIFNGFTPGIGLDIRPGFLKNMYFSVSVVHPYRSSEIDDYKDFMTRKYFAKYEDPPIVGIALGVNVIIN